MKRTRKKPASQVIKNIVRHTNSYFLYWNFAWKSCFVVFFLKWNEWKNPQFNFSSQNLSIERNFFKWDGKETKILHLHFHRFWKNSFLHCFLKLEKCVWNRWGKKINFSSQNSSVHFVGGWREYTRFAVSFSPLFIGKASVSISKRWKRASHPS